MKRKELGVTNLVGILLVAVALISAGGLYLLGSEYCRISDTLVSVTTEYADLEVIHDPAAEQYQVIITLPVYNPSDLDVEIYSIEYDVYANTDTTSLMGTSSSVGGGSSGLADGTVAAHSYTNLTVAFLIGQGSLYYQRFENALAGGNSTWMYMDGFALYKLADYDVDGIRLGLWFGPEEVVVNG